MSWQDEATQLLTERYGALVGYARLVCSDPADAEDMVQEAMISVFSRARTFPNLRAAEGYVKRAIVTRTIDRARARKRDAEPEVLTREIDTAPGPEQRAVDKLSVAAALAHLSPRERACIVLRYIEQLSTSETARTLGLREGSVKRYVHDASKKLSATLGVEALPPEWSGVAAGGGERRV
ncbi:RNA polymerase sigma factor [Demequina zhanjiangensis]|uniref:Sigma-70 family RNA polymerase sigma factor n=1 Tax=Demequina zhanjiangensis TaxID=3051659 RepID=A0ABT8FZW0_9MICO|nr:sigma-70 family RNA polymerase sigma factor [Demequina sp. SYSU T00b26]MDN4472297.1 sigma-70 family RNA polymerase sigma factor [Demequina sp. SYSU T00b26]